MINYNQQEPVERIFLPGINQNLEIYFSPDRNYHTQLKYHIIQFDKKTKQNQNKWVDSFKEDETIPGLLKKVQREISFHKNFHDRWQQDRDWQALVFLTNQIQTHSNVGGKK